MKKHLLIASVLAAGSTLVALKYIKRIQSEHLKQTTWHSHVEAPICFKPTQSTYTNQHPVVQGAQAKFVPHGVNTDSDTPVIVPDEDKKIHALFAGQLDAIIKDFAKNQTDEGNTQSVLHDLVQEPIAQSKVVAKEAASLVEKSADIVKEKIEQVVTVHSIGDDKEAGEVSPTSKAFRSLLNKALKAAEKSEDYRLVLAGRTYGLGSKGVKNEDGTVSYTAADIKKLIKKFETIV